MFWEFIVMIPIIYTVTAMPIDLFYLANDGNVWSALDTTVAVIFGVDIILCFFSAYIDDNNTLITDLRRIVPHYLLTWFILDFLSVFPFVTVLQKSTSVQSNQLFRLGRIIRILRLLRLLRLTRLFRSGLYNKFTTKVQSVFVLSGPMARLVKIIILLLVAAHLLGGFWYFIGDLHSNSWVDETIVGSGTVREADLTTKYFISVYFVVVTLSTTGYGDIHAVNAGEFGFVICVILLGEIGSSIIIADILGIISSLDKRSQAQRQRAAAVQQLLYKVKLKSSLRRKLLEWAADVNKSISSISDVMPMLPVDLRREVIMSTQQSVIDRVPLFQEMSELEGFKELVADLIWMSQRYSVEPNTPLWVCGQKAREIVVVLDGQLDISMVDETDPSRSTPVDEMGPGDLCGEFECLLLHKHVTDCKTKTAVDLLVLDVKQLEALCQQYPLFLVHLRRMSIARMQSYEIASLWIGEEGSGSGGGSSPRPDGVEGAKWSGSRLAGVPEGSEEDGTSSPLSHRESKAMDSPPSPTYKRVPTMLEVRRDSLRKRLSPLEVSEALNLRANSDPNVTSPPPTGASGGPPTDLSDDGDKPDSAPNSHPSSPITLSRRNSRAEILQARVHGLPTAASSRIKSVLSRTPSASLSALAEIDKEAIPVGMETQATPPSSMRNRFSSSFPGADVEVIREVHVVHMPAVDANGTGNSFFESAPPSAHRTLPISARLSSSKSPLSSEKAHPKESRPDPSETVFGQGSPLPVHPPPHPPPSVAALASLPSDASSRLEALEARASEHSGLLKEALTLLARLTEGRPASSQLTPSLNPRLLNRSPLDRMDTPPALIRTGTTPGRGGAKRFADLVLELGRPASGTASSFGVDGSVASVAADGADVPTEPASVAVEPAPKPKLVAQTSGRSGWGHVRSSLLGMTGVSNRSLLSTSTPNGSAEPTPKDIPPTPGPKLWLDVDDGRGDDDSVR